MKRKRLALLLAAALTVTSVDGTAFAVSGADFSSEPVLDEAEAMYRRAAVFICLQEESSLLGELSDLRHQLRLLSEMEQLSIKNVL